MIDPFIRILVDVTAPKVPDGEGLTMSQKIELGIPVNRNDYYTKRMEFLLPLRDIKYINQSPEGTGCVIHTYGEFLDNNPYIPTPLSIEVLDNLIVEAQRRYIK